MSNGPIEPSADLRQMAAAFREIYIALILEGFTEAEALTIIGHIIATNRGGA